MIIEIKEYQWNKYRAEYCKWYKNKFGVSRGKLTTQNDMTQLISYIQAYLCPGMSTIGEIRIMKKSGFVLTIKYEVNCK